MTGERVAVCFPEELQILLNILGPRITIAYPPYGFPLLEAEVQREGYRFIGRCSRNDFESARSGLGELAARELPEYSDLVLCALNAGVEQYQNWDEFLRYRHAISQMKKGHRFVLDTNLLYHGLPHNAGIDPSLFMLVEVTKGEIRGAMNSKYTSAQIAELKHGVQRQRHLMDALMNRRTRRSRLATYLALREYIGMKDRIQEVAGAGAPTHDREENDRVIVKTLKDLEGRGSFIPILLTADQSMGDLCQIEGIEHFVLHVPFSMEGRRCTHAEMVALLFSLATVFGFVQCNQVLIFGEFGGKGSDLNELMLDLQNHRIGEEFVRDCEVCRALIGLGIKS